jgi:ATP-dependent exoDNAse (exonuclease V) beta subunit
MTWSYSRITTFEDCPYRFFLSYLKHLQKQPLFFSDYGKFIHKIIERYLTGALNESELISYYLSNFRREVRGAAPTSAVFKTYFEQGLQYFENMVFPYPTPLATEQRVDFLIEDKPFTGIIDCVAERDNALVVLDNKSRALKPRTARKKPTKYDEELDTYLRQLYLYCVPTKDRFHQYPDRLEINCFRTGQLISEPFREEAFEKTKEWALSTIETITNNEDWSPRLDYWKCRYLCDLNHHCEYYQLNRGWSP